VCVRGVGLVHAGSQDASCKLWNAQQLLGTRCFQIIHRAPATLQRTVEALSAIIVLFSRHFPAVTT
jgi:hypothetical protein